jgi:signal transduction histidine kinase
VRIQGVIPQTDEVGRVRQWWSADGFGGGAALSASARVEWLLWRVFVLIRAATVAQTAIAAGLVWDRIRSGAVIVTLLVAATAESAVVVEACRRRGDLRGSRLAAAVDLLATVAAVVATVLALRPSADPYMDVVFYPYSVASMTLAGFSVRRLPGAVLAAAVASGTYAAAVLGRFAFEVGLLTNAATYWGWVLVAFAVTGALRGLSRSLDQARRAAVQSAQQQERAETSRELHDHALQALEVAAQDGRVPDEQTRGLLISAAARLRSWLEGRLEGGPDDLVVGLDAVVREQGAKGLRVRLLTAAMTDRIVGCLVVEALCGAVTETLTNVRKHSGLTAAVVRAARDNNVVTVTVVDQGRGFDTRQAVQGLGTRHSIIGRLEQIGGQAWIRSAPGDGTQVELRVDLAQVPEGG